MSDSDGDEEEESKMPPMQEGVDPEEFKEMQRRKKEAKEFKALLQEIVFTSTNKKNEWKRKEVAILMVTSFIKDISAFLIRTPVYDLILQMFDRIILSDFEQAPLGLRVLLYGRALQCSTAVIDCDIVPRGEQGGDFKQRLLLFAAE